MLMVKRLKSKIYSYAILTLLVLVPATLFFMPREKIFNGPTTCLSQRFFHRSCLGCGMTRALYSCMHGDFKKAHALNWRVWIIAPLLGIYWVQLIIFYYNRLERG